MAERDWIATTAETLGIITIIGGAAGRWFFKELGLVKASLKADIDGAGSNIVRVELEQSQLKGRVDTFEKKQLVMEFQLGNAQSHIDRLEGVVSKIADLDDKRAEAHTQRYEDIRDRLARIEENNRLCETLDKNMGAIAEILKDRR